MKTRLWMSLMGVMLWCGAAAARGDTVFDLNATLTQTGVANPGMGTLKGTFTFNTATGTLDGLSLTFANPGMNAYNTVYNLNFVFGGPTSGTPTEYGITGFVVPYQASLFLYLPVAAPLIGYGGGPICSVAYACFSSQDGVTRENSAVSVGGGSLNFPAANATYVVDTGMLTAETPEPSSVLMVGSGLLSLAGVLRRRIL